MRFADVLVVASVVSLTMPTLAHAAPGHDGAAAPDRVDKPPADVAPTEMPSAETGASESAPTAPDPEDVMFAAQVQAAQDHYKEAKALMSEGRYASAAAEYERSFASVEFGDTLFKIIDAYDKASEPVKALAKARQYLQLTACEGGRETSTNYPCREPEQKAQARAQAERLRGLVGELRLLPSKGVVLREVRVADRIVPVSEFPVMLLPGSYVVSTKGAKAGQSQSYDVEIDAGETYNLSVAPFPVPSPPVVDDRQGDRRPDIGDEPRINDARRKRILKGFFWGGVGLTAASGIVTGVLGALTVQETRAFNRELCEGECTDEEKATRHIDPVSGNYYPKSHKRKSNKLRPATNATIGVTAGLGVVTVVVGIFAFSKRPTGVNARVQVRRNGLAVHF